MDQANKKRMLITGISGQLGSNIAHCLNKKYDILGLYHDYKMSGDEIQTEKVDLLAQDSIGALVKEFHPQIVIHSAAIADVDYCQENPELAEKVNVLGTRNLVDSLEGSQAKLIYISTDLVYDGVKGNYSEEDPINPLNQYGQTKYEGECEALKRSGSLIARTNFFGWNIQDRFSLAEWVLDNLLNGRVIKGFTDSFFSSIYNFRLAQLLDMAIEKDLSGVYHFASNSSLSKYEFAVKIAKCFDLDQSLIKPASIDDFDFKAKRAKNLSLNVNKLMSDLACSVPSMDESIEEFYSDYQLGIPEKIKRNNKSTIAAN